MSELETKAANRRPWTREWAADLISNLTSPPLIAIPTLVALGVYDQSRHGFSAWQLLIALLAAVFLSAVFPIGYVLYLKSRNRVSAAFLPIRQQRTLPYIVSIVSVLLAFVAVYALIGGGALAGMMLSLVINGLVVLIINLAWKISAHAIGVAQPLAALTVLFGWIILPLYLLLPVVDWARVYIKAHTLGQVLAGTFCGLVLTTLEFLLLFKPLGWF